MENAIGQSDRFLQTRIPGLNTGLIVTPKVITHYVTYSLCKSKLFQSFIYELFCPSFHTALGVVKLIVLIQR
jgi:hypothetical protein